MHLFIDTSDSHQTKIGLLNPEGVFQYQKVWEAQQNQSEELLAEIDGLLLRTGIKLRSIGKVLVISGPGSYTGLRVGIATANALSMALAVPALGVTKPDFEAGNYNLNKTDNKSIAAAFYLKPPHITQGKDIDTKS